MCMSDMLNKMTADAANILNRGIRKENEMENTFVVNIIHRPEMVPEYAEKVTGQGKAEDIGRKALLTESLDIFKFQQETAHKNGLKTTIQMTYASLFNDEAVELAKEHHERYGDEIALSLLGLPCTEFREKYKTKDFCIWMFSMEDKKSIVDDVLKFYVRMLDLMKKSPIRNNVVKRKQQLAKNFTS